MNVDIGARRAWFIAKCAVAAAAAIALPPGPALAAPTADEVFAEICRLGILHPEIVIRQALHETGNLRSGMLMQRNNLFGFRYKSYLTFADWKDSLAYYKQWQARRYTNPREDYFVFLRRIKYASGNYKSFVMNHPWPRACPAEAR